jgi:hypothetical protein
MQLEIIFLQNHLRLSSNRILPDCLNEMKDKNLCRVRRHIT